MKKQEIMEIKRTFIPDNEVITDLVGWIINENGETIAHMKEKFWNLPEEMMLKFLELFKRTLTGKIRKNLYNLEFIPHADAPKKLRDIRDSRFQKDTYRTLMLDIAEKYKENGRFAIFMIHGAYDIPGKTKDGNKLEDASEETYEYIMTCICPVKMSAPALGMEVDSPYIQPARRQWIIGKPDTAFIYPAFNDRSQDFDHIWYYTRRPDEPAKELIQDVLECHLPQTPKDQKESFLQSVKEGDCKSRSLEEIKEIYQKLQALSINAELSGQGITKEQLEDTLGVEYKGIDTEIILRNVMDLHTLNVFMADASVSVAADRTDLVEMRTIDGEQYVCIKTNGIVMANGMEIDDGKED